MTQKVVTECKMKSRQEKTSLGQIVTDCKAQNEQQKTMRGLPCLDL